MAKLSATTKITQQCSRGTFRAMGNCRNSIGNRYASRRCILRSGAISEAIVIPSEVEESRCETHRWVRGVLRLRFAALRMTCIDELQIENLEVTRQEIAGQARRLRRA